MKKQISFATLLIFLTGSALFAQAYQGYTLFSPNNSRYTYLVDMNNQIVHQWSHTKTGGYSCYLLEDGSLMRSAVASSSQLNGGGATGVVQKIAWNGAVLWEYTYATSTYRSHHDIEPLPNGNVLLIAWETKTAAQCVAAGLNHSASLWPDHIIEVQPVGTNGGNIVWKWHFWDHLIQDYDASKANYGVVAQHPELLDINIGSTQGDWMHVNGISHNPELDQIVFSSHNLDEVYVIDHGTTIAEAASHSGGRWGKGGDILYRWGKPSNYDAPGSQIFNVVHSAFWVSHGNPGSDHILAFNNREGQGTSMVVELNPEKDAAGNYIRTPGTAFGPVAPYWSYTATGFYSNHLGGCQRLPNGNTIIAESTSGYLFEVDSLGQTVWSYNRGGEIVRALRYPPNYAGLTGLPVEFIAFTGSVVDGNVELDWQTGSETNNSGFDVMRSYDNVTFTKIGSVEGAGTTAVGREYSYTDRGVAPGKYWYAVRQVDLDGTVNSSNSIEIDVLQPNGISLKQNYPNPFNPSTTIEFIIPVAQHVKIEVVDIMGKVVSVLLDGTADAGSNKVVFDASGFSSGVYFYRVTSEKYVKTLPMVFSK